MPNRFIPVNPGTPMEHAIAAINNNFAQLDSEGVTKTFKGPNGNTIVEGRLPYTGGYGSLYYDSNGLARIIIGILPDGTTGIVQSKDGIDVINDIAW